MSYGGRMSSYNELYKKYYENLSSIKVRYKKNNNVIQQNNSYSRNYNDKRKEKIPFVNKFIIQLSISTFLILFFLGCRTIQNQYTNEVMNIAEKTINKNYNYKVIKEKIKDLKFEDIERYSIDAIEKVKSKILGIQTWEEQLKNEYSLPVSAKPSNDKTKDIDNTTLIFDVDKNIEIKSCNNGKIKKIEKDKELGEYVLIDHGKGIESKYYNLSSIDVKVGDVIEKGHKIGTVKEEKSKNFYFQILYMGKSQNIYDYISM